MFARCSRVAVVLGLLSLPIYACTRNNEVSAAATKPMSPAEGTKDYEQNPMGPYERPPVPKPSGEPQGKEPAAPGEPAGGPAPIAECPPKCSPQGGWIGCGLTKIRAAKCEGCTPKCKAKGTPDEGWYDCSGVLIVQRPCSGS